MSLTSGVGLDWWGALGDVGGDGGEGLVRREEVGGWRSREVVQASQGVDRERLFFFIARVYIWAPAENRLTLIGIGAQSEPSRFGCGH